MTIGERIKELRKKEGLSQEQFAEKLTVSRAAVAKWENDNGVPDIENLKHLSELFDISLDVLLDNSVHGKSKESLTDTPDTLKFYKTYIGEKCSIEMTDWNDGISDSYLLNQDSKFLYYIKFEKKAKRIGALAKQYIEQITLCPNKKKETVDLSDFTKVQKEYFINKSVNIDLNDKHFLDGILGKDIELPNAPIVDIHDDYVVLASGKKIEMEKIAKMEILLL